MPVKIAYYSEKLNKTKILHFHCLECNSICRVDKPVERRRSWVRTDKHFLSVLKEYGKIIELTCPGCRRKMNYISEVLP